MPNGRQKLDVKLIRRPVLGHLRSHPDPVHSRATVMIRYKHRLQKVLGVVSTFRMLFNAVVVSYQSKYAEAITVA